MQEPSSSTMADVRVENIENVKELITEIVEPKNRPNINIIPEHITMLRGNKIKKQIKGRVNKKRREQSKRLTRKEFQNLGLYNQPRKSLDYKDFLPLHKLWKGYIKDHLNLIPGGTIPDICDPGYDSFSKVLVKSDFHGAKIICIKATCPSLVGASGILILDTMNTLQVIGEDNKLRVLPKAHCVFSIKLGSLDFIIFGKHLAIRPEERSVKKIKNFIDPHL